MSRTKKQIAEEPLKNFHIQPKNRNQDKFLDAMRKNQMIVALGPAGTGKSYCAGSMAASLLASGKINQIIVTRPNISTGRSLGFFPGTVEEKLLCWLMPILSVIRSRMGRDKFEYCKNKEQIKLQPLETIRGQSFDDAFIIVDESQNLSIEEIKALSTRIGEGSRMVFLGDLTQKDIKESGLQWFSYICEKHNLDLPVIRFSTDDIVRSDIVKRLVKAYEFEAKFESQK